MKAIIRFMTSGFILSVVFLTVGCGKATAEVKTAYVDIAKVFDEFEKTKSYDDELQGQGREKEEQRENIVQEIRQLKDEITLLTGEAKDEKQELVNQKVQELQDFERETRRELGQQRDKVVRDIFKDIDDAVQRYGERKGIDFIFNERALVYRNPKLDITQEILGELNKGYKKK